MTTLKNLILLPPRYLLYRLERVAYVSSLAVAQSTRDRTHQQETRATRAGSTPHRHSLMSKPHTIHVTTGTPQPGGWCDHCNLPSLLEVPVNIVNDVGVQTIGTFTTCTEHSTTH